MTRLTGLICLLALTAALFTARDVSADPNHLDGLPIEGGVTPRHRPRGPTLTIDEVRALALEGNADLEAARAAAAEARGLLRQERAWANPELDVDVEGVGGDEPGWDRAEITWSASQRIEPFGTRRARSEGARHGRDAALHSLAIARLDLLAEIERRFADALAANARVAVFEEYDSLAVAMIRTVTALVEAGEVSPVEIDRVEAERAASAAQLRVATLERRDALRALARLWGGEEEDCGGVRGHLEIDARLPDRDSLLSAAIDLPDVELSNARLKRAEAEARLAGRARLPDVAVRGGVKRLSETGSQSYVGGVSVALPLFDRGGGGLDQARALERRARADRGAAIAGIRLDRASAHDALAAAIVNRRAMREETLPRIQAIHASIREGYLRGKFGLLDLMEAHRSSLQGGLEYVEALRSLWIARADLRRLTGGSPEWSAAMEEGERE
ncbi:MAG: TolC family protein [Candidatus Eisenbacteria bacterium]|nr:TolC family protein [Candidatus Eisenbacteria bacterium]